MTRKLNATAVLLAMGLAPAIAWAQERPDPPPPPHEGRRDADEDRLRRADERDRAVDQYRRATDRVRRLQDVIIQRGPLPLVERPDIPPDSAWLGVQLTPVPAALAHHLRLEEKGVMIGNIFEGSPAEKAGLDRYDVIVSADGKPILSEPDAVMKFSQHVRDKRPGEALELVVISRTQEKRLRLELGKPPTDWSRAKPKYEEDPDIALQREFGLRGRIMRPGPNGEWIMEDLELFPKFREKLEQGLRRERLPERDDRQKRVEEAVRVDKEGVTLQVHRDPDGQITVRRYKTGQDPDKNRVVHKNMDQLREADREAYDLLRSATSHEGPVERPLPGGPIWPGPDARSLDPKDRSDTWREWERRFFRGPLKDLKELDALKELKERQAAPPPPKTSFEVTADGKIIVHFRDGDAEMTRTFDSPEQLREKAPNLFKQYERLQDRMKE